MAIEGPDSIGHNLRGAADISSGIIYRETQVAMALAHQQRSVGDFTAGFDEAGRTGFRINHGSRGLDLDLAAG